MYRLWICLLFFSAVFFCIAEDADDPLRSQAISGDPAAQFRLGNDYYYGGGGRKVNHTLAAHWFKKAADAGIPEAQFNYALCLDLGHGVEKSPHEAYRYYEKASASGFRPALLNCAMTLLRGIPPDLKKRELPLKADPYKAMMILENLNTQDFTPAKIELAQLLLYREKTEPAWKRAFELLSDCESEVSDNPRVFRMLADCYYGGFGTKSDPEKMIAYLEKAASLGDVEAKGKLAYCYEYGQPVKENREKAFQLYKEAAFAGLPMAQLKYGDYIADGKEEGLGLDEAIRWYEKSAAAGCPQAFFKLGVLAGEGIGMQKSETVAAHFFFRAAKLGYARAQYNLACIYMKDNGPFPKDESAAVYWFEQAANGNDASAQRRLAICYFEGTGIKKDPQKGNEWLLRAASNGDPLALQMIEQARRSAW